MTKQYDPAPVLDAVAHVLKASIEALESRIDSVAEASEDRSDELREQDQERHDLLLSLNGQICDLRTQNFSKESELEEAIAALQMKLVAGLNDTEKLTTQLLAKALAQGAEVVGLRDQSKEIVAAITSTQKEVANLFQNVVTPEELEIQQQELADKWISGLEDLRNDAVERAERLSEGLAAVSEAMDELAADAGVDAEQRDSLAKDIEARLEYLAGDIAKADASLAVTRDELGIIGLQVAEVPTVVEGHVGELRDKFHAQVRAITGAIEHHIETADERYVDLDDSLQAVGKRVEVVNQKFVDWNELYLNAVTWGRGGSAYKQGAIAKHRGGVWQAAETTEDEPGPDSAWRILADGLDAFEAERVDNEHVELVSRFASGIEKRSQPIQVSRNNPTGQHSETRVYEPGDIFIYRRNTYIVLQRGTIADPSTSALCALLIKGGQRGARGPQGIPGEAPEMNAILRAWQSYLDQGDGAPIQTYRGNWKYQETYARGDVVVFQNSLRICLEQNDGTQPPGGSPGQPANSAWSVLFAPSSGGSGGGGGGDVDVGTTDITMEGTNIIFEDDQGDEIMSLPQTMYLVSDAISDNAAQIAQNTLDIAALESSQQYVRTGATGEVYYGAGAGVQYNAPLEIDVATVDTEGAVDLVNNQIVLDAVLTSGTAVRYAVVFQASQYTSQIGEFSLFQNDVIVPGTTVTWNMDPDSGADVIVAPNGGVATIGPVVANGTALTAGARIDVRCGIQGNTKPITVESYQIDISLAAATAKGHAIVDQDGNFTPYNSLLQFAGATVTVTDGVVSGGDQDGNTATVVDVSLGPGGTLVDYGEQPQDLGSLSATLTVDISQGQSVLATLTGDVSTVAFQNPTGHTATSFVLLLTTGGFTVTDWTGAVAGWFGSAPDLSTAGVHGVAFELLGGNWYGTYKGLVS